MQLSLSEPQFLLLSCGPMTAQLGPGSNSWANSYKGPERAQQLNAGQQSPQAPWEGECWGRGCDSCSLSPTPEEATEPLLQAKNTQQCQGGLLPRNKNHCAIILQLLAKSGSKEFAVKSKQQLRMCFRPLFSEWARTMALSLCGSVPVTAPTSRLGAHG